MDPNPLGTLMVFLIIFFTKNDFEKSAGDNKNMKNYPARKE